MKTYSIKHVFMFDGTSVIILKNLVIDAACEVLRQLKLKKAEFGDIITEDATFGTSENNYFCFIDNNGRESMVKINRFA